MRILFDQGTLAPLRHELTGHQVTTTYEMGWDTLSNGDLLRQAESQFELLITTDQSLCYQQDLTGRRLAILVLPTTSWPRIRQRANEVATAIGTIQPGELRDVRFFD